MKKNKYSCDCNIIHEDVVNDTIRRISSISSFDSLSSFFKILGDNTRLLILFALDNNMMCVCDLANVLNMTKSSISHQLSILRREKIVKPKRIGREVYYTLDDDHIKQVFEVALEHVNHKAGDFNV